ncbi:hypothetical protein [Phascolarctobacterium sp.]
MTEQKAKYSDMYTLHNGDDVHFCPTCEYHLIDTSQTWATSQGLNYSRTAYRLRVIIPGKHLRNLVTAREFVKALPAESRYFVEDWPGSEEWYIYKGEILPQWIKEIVKMEEHTKND